MIEELRNEINRLESLADEHFCPSDPDYGFLLKSQWINECQAKMAKIGDTRERDRRRRDRRIAENASLHSLSNGDLAFRLECERRKRHRLACCE